MDFHDQQWHHWPLYTWTYRVPSVSLGLNKLRLYAIPQVLKRICMTGKDHEWWHRGICIIHIDKHNQWCHCDAMISSASKSLMLDLHKLGDDEEIVKDLSTCSIWLKARAILAMAVLTSNITTDIADSTLVLPLNTLIPQEPIIM